MDSFALLQAQAARIRASEILGRSRLINSLFDYLVECAREDRVPKEIDVAIDAFDRGTGFDSSQDAIVRVCIHKLKRKLDDFYAGPGKQEPVRIALARGEYRLVLEQTPGAPPPAGKDLEQMAAVAPDNGLPGAVHRPASRRLAWTLIMVAGLLVSLAANLWLWGQPPSRDTEADSRLDEVRSSAVWAPLFDDDLPIYVVVGNYYVFAEVDEFLGVKRLIRDFDINSAEDLERAKQHEPERAQIHEDLNLDYVPTASAFALRAIMPVLAAANRRVHLTVMSELDPAILTSAHVIYVGYLSGLGMLHSFVFSASRFTRGETFDELIDSRTGTNYVSEVLGPVQGKLRYRDYGYVSTFPGPAGNQLIVITGTRDIAVMQTAEMLTDVRRIDELQRQVESPEAMEALYEVYAFENTNLDASLLLASDLDTAGIWTAHR